MKPFLKYRGGKYKEITNFIDYLPNQFDRYIEPFIGGGALYFYLEHSNSIINDINTKLTNTYSEIKKYYPIVRRQLDELQSIYELNQEKYRVLKAEYPLEKVTNHNEALYYKLRDEFNYPSGEWLDAVLYFFINKTAYSGMIRYNKNGEYNVPFGRYKNFNTKLLNDSHRELLKNTQIYNKNYADIFEMANKDDFIFLDPPYDCVFTSYGNEEFTGDFAEKEHIQLAEDFKNLSCKSLMVISKTPLTTDLYKNYIVEEYHVNYSVNIRNRFKNDAKHYVICNYPVENIQKKPNQLELNLS